MGYIVDQYGQGKAGLAFTGDRNAIWHRLGNVVNPDDSPEAIAIAARMDFTVEKSRALARTAGHGVVETDRYFITRRDTGAVLSPTAVSEQYRIDDIQPTDFIRFAKRYSEQDKRFKFSAAGALDGGARIWATASFGDLTVAGERHLVFLLLSTTYDASAPTEACISVVRAICDNTLAAALGDGNTRIKVRHNSTFRPDVVASQLAKLAQASTRFKAVGDAMAAFEMTREQVSAFLRECLAIPVDVKIEDISTRKQNQLRDLHNAYRASVTEGAPKQSAWACLQALTRYVDHDRSTRNAGGDESAKRVLSAQWGSGNAMKESGMATLQNILKAANKLPALA